MSKMILPIEAEDINKVIGTLMPIVKKMVKVAEESDEQDILLLAYNLLVSIDDDVIKSLSDLVKDIQGVALLGKGKAMMTGTAGPAPDKASLCASYMSFFTDDGEEREAGKRAEFPTRS